MFKGVIVNLVLLFCFITTGAAGQELDPQGRFLSDSIKIGIPVAYSLSVKYPKDMDVVFPDSLYSYSPFELYRKEYFPTKSDSLYSYDSAVYYVTSFEVDTVQDMALPVFLLQGKDSTAFFPARDSVILQQLVTEIPDSVAIEAMPLIENTTYKRVRLQFNYPYFIIGAIILVIIVVLVIVLFGKKIKKFFYLRRLHKAHEQFIQKYDAIALADDVPVKVQAENLLKIWKSYLERLEGTPYTRLTTKEIIMNYKPEGIEDSLKTMDRTIYSQQVNGKLMREYTALKKYSQLRYEEKIEEVKHG